MSGSRWAVRREVEEGRWRTAGGGRGCGSTEVGRAGMQVEDIGVEALGGGKDRR